MSNSEAELDERLARALIQVIDAIYAVAKNANAERRARLMSISLVLSEVIEAGAYEKPKLAN